MHCLNCKQEMTNYVIHTPLHQVSYNVCEHCGSLWLDKGVLNKLAPTGSGDIEFCYQDVVAGGQKANMCPRCDNEPMDKVKFIGNDKIILEHCKNCEGFWLDGGQLDQIDNHLESIMHARKTGFSEFMTETHLPFWIKRISRPSDEVDFKVPVMPIKGAKVKTQTQDTCPVCHIHLDLYSDFHIDFEGCPRCRGMWLNVEKIKQLKSKVEDGDIRWMDDELEVLEKTKAMVSNRLCPQCTETKLMSTKFGHSNLIIDWCPSCHGVWLDRDDFLSIVHYLDNEEDHLTAGEMLHEAEEEVKKIWTGHEHKVTEIVDAEKALGALLNISIYEHPAMSRFLIKAGEASHTAGF